MEEQGFWDDPEKSQATMRELKELKDSFENYNELERQMNDAREFIEIAEEENDASMIPEIAGLVSQFRGLFE